MRAPGQWHFFVVFHNNGFATQQVVVRAAVAGVYTAGGGVRGAVDPGGAGSFELGGAAPDLVDVEAGWGRVTFSGPEIAGTWVLHVSFPDGASWKGFP